MGKTITDVLFEKYAELTNLWRKAEESLGHVPHAVSVCIGKEIIDEGQGQVTMSFFLGVQKIGSEWRICLNRFRDDEMTVPNWKPIVDCNIEKRAMATKHLKQLQFAVQQARSDFIATVDDAIQTLASAIQ